MSLASSMARIPTKVLILTVCLAVTGFGAGPLVADSRSVDLSLPESITVFFSGHGFKALPDQLVPQYRWQVEARTCQRANAAVGGDSAGSGLVGFFARQSDGTLHALCYFNPMVRLESQHAAHACHLVGLVLERFEGTLVWCREGNQA